MEIYIPKPWEPDRYETRRMSTHSRRGSSEYTAIHDNLVDYDNTYWKLGDLIRFENCYNIYRIKNNWQFWYYKDADRERYIKENCKKRRSIPHYASEEIAIILGRYRIKKFKWHGIYTDYGSVVMMLSGPCIGHVRRYYCKRPWDRFATYPYSEDFSELFQGVPVVDDVKIFLENLMEKIAYED